MQQPEPQGLRFPKPTKVICPEPEPAPEVIYLRHVERARPQVSRPEDEERVYETPVFVLPLKGKPEKYFCYLLMYYSIKTIDWFATIDSSKKL